LIKIAGNLMPERIEREELSPVMIKKKIGEKKWKDKIRKRT